MSQAAYQDVVVPNFYESGMWPKNGAKEDEKNDAMKAALLRLFHRLPEDQAKRIYFEEFEPLGGSTTFRGRFQVSDTPLEDGEWFEFAQRLSGKMVKHRDGCEYCGTRHSATNCPNCGAPRR